MEYTRDQLFTIADADERTRWIAADDREAHKIDEMRDRVLTAGKGLHRADLSRLSEEIWLAELERDATDEMRRFVTDDGGPTEGPEFTNSVRNYALGMIRGWSDPGSATMRTDRERLLQVAAIAAAVKTLTGL